MMACTQRLQTPWLGQDWEDCFVSYHEGNDGSSLLGVWEEDGESW